MVRPGSIIYSSSEFLAFNLERGTLNGLLPPTINLIVPSLAG
jgi:hypothetical protein